MSVKEDFFGIILDKTTKMYLNIAILFVGFTIMLYVYQKNRSTKDENFDWAKYTITPLDLKYRKKNEIKMKNPNKQSKAPGVKDTSKNNQQITKDQDPSRLLMKDYGNEKEIFLNDKEMHKFQEVMNYAVENSFDDGEGELAEQSIYNLFSHGNGNDVPDFDFEDVAKVNEYILGITNSNSSEREKIEKVLRSYSKLRKIKNLSEEVYYALIKLFLKNKYLPHASFFMSQIDRLGYKIPREILDLFLMISIEENYFDIEANNKERKKINKEKYSKSSVSAYNKFDAYEHPDFAYYRAQLETVKNKDKKQLNDLYMKLKLESKPFYPKGKEGGSEEGEQETKNLLSKVDLNNIKEYTPKNFKVKKIE